MKKRLFYFPRELPRIFGILCFTAAVFLFGSCKAAARDSIHPDTVKVFAAAGLPLLREKVAPRDFSLPLVLPGEAGSLGKPQSLGALKGKVVFLNFWATWCGPCRAEMPSMENLYASYKEKGLEILAVNCRENLREVAAFMKDNGFSFPAALDADGRVSASYGIQAIPTTFLLDREGKIILRVMGSLDWDRPEIRAALDHLLN